MTLLNRCKSRIMNVKPASECTRGSDVSCWRQSSTSAIPLAALGEVPRSRLDGGGGGEEPLARIAFTEARLCSLTTLPAGLAQPEWPSDWLPQRRLSEYSVGGRALPFRSGHSAGVIVLNGLGTAPTDAFIMAWEDFRSGLIFALASPRGRIDLLILKCSDTICSRPFPFNSLKLFDENLAPRLYESSIATAQH